MQVVPPPKRCPRVSVAVPASFVSDVPHLREKTLKIGLVGRASAIFRVDEVIVFPDQPRANLNREASLIATILAYMETPQYLRKLLFRISPELQYAGVLPPLRTPHHPLQNRKRDLKNGEFREGVAVAADKQGTLVEIGVENPILVPHVQIPLNSRITVKIASADKQYRAVLANPNEIGAYWGYKVTVSRAPFGRMVKEKPFDLVLATSRRGTPFTDIADDIRGTWKKSRNVLVAFGSPTQGLQEIAKHEGLELDDIADYVVNTVPNQATETVRTEEALCATLAVLNLLATME